MPISTINVRSKHLQRFKNPHSLMIQGTTSDAGKSVLVTAICRILARHHIAVAPFKSQNMALNSAVTAEGGEIGRAQAVQAQGANIAPSVLMNPVLLKPNSDVGSQVIVNGQSIGNMKAREYHEFKPQLLQQVITTYQRLQQSYPVTIIEGAGSPAEINLREHDIANMGFAQAIDCPVLIVADIDRGGVFAHLYGTYALLSDTEQQRVAGFIINRFRGDVSLLQSGLDWLEQKTSVPTLAVIPYISNLHIESEDAVAQVQQKGDAKLFKIVVPLYPRASNHTDFDVLRLNPMIDCQFVRDASLFSGADLIILPGSKNVSNDLQWLKDNGWPQIIERHLRYAGKVMGICGGYQMLGEKIHDPLGIENTVTDKGANTIAGLGLLKIETTLAQTKTLTNAQGSSVLTGTPLHGYEIHAGISRGEDLERAWFKLQSHKNNQSSQQLNDSDEYYDGAINAYDSIRGTYLHGVFEGDQIRAEILSWAGMEQLEQFNYVEFREQQIERLADEVETVLPFATLANILQLDHLNDSALAQPSSNSDIGNLSKNSELNNVL